MRNGAWGLWGVLVTTSAQAGPVAWVDWQSNDASSVYGVAIVDGSTVAVTYTGEWGFVQTSCGTDYWSGNPSPYVSATVDNPPNANLAPDIRCDIIALALATPKTLEFARPVTNPLFAVVSLNGNGYRFDRDFEILGFGPGYWGNGTLTKQITTNPDGSVTYDVIGTGEPHGVLQFIGTFSAVHWTSLTTEYWNGFSIAVEHLAENVPPEIDVRERGQRLVHTQTTAVDLGIQPVGTSTTLPISIVNLGSGPLNFTGITITGPGAAQFRTGWLPPALAAGSTVSFALTFTATSVATSTASLTISSDDMDEFEFTFPIRGHALIDTDRDGVIDAYDNCPVVANADQQDLDRDRQGDACDDDADGDLHARAGDCNDFDATVFAVTTYYGDADADQIGDTDDPLSLCAANAPAGAVLTSGDNCPDLANSDQANLDSDAFGDVCDDDADNDGVIRTTDCDDLDPTAATELTTYADTDGDGFGEPGGQTICAGAAPNGRVTNDDDNCPSRANPSQADADGDGVGDACEGPLDDDADDDGFASADDCDDQDPAVHAETTYFADTDGDGHGDPAAPELRCAATPPAGLVISSDDNCPNVANPEQTDADHDGKGAACDDPEVIEEVPTGCSCRAEGHGSPVWGLLLLGLAFLGRRPRARRS